MIPALILFTAGVSALGLNTDEWTNPSSAMVSQVQALSDALASAAKGEQPKVTVQDTINKIKELADSGNDKDAQFAMGFFLQQSNQPGGLDQALAYYKKAAANGQLSAMNNYGFILAAAAQDVAKAKEGIAEIKKASDKGFNPARRNMAAIYMRGMAGEKQDIEAAQKLLEAAASNGDHQAQFELAQFHLGAGGESKKDENKAWDLINKAADAGNANALSVVGSVLFDGGKVGTKEIKAEPAKAVERFTKLADQGVPTGLRVMGEIYERGLAGVKKDFTKALEYFVRAAQGNDAMALLRLASYYDGGVDVDPKDNKVDVQRNDAAALQLYLLAAQNNVPLAIYNVGTFFEAGRSVQQDPQRAFAFFLQAAGSGFVPAMQKVGAYYLNGAGTFKDAVAATSWFARSAGAGLPEGLLSLGIMAENGLYFSNLDSTPFRTAADQYTKAADSPAAAPNVQLEALLRLGSLHARGLMVNAGSTAQPDFEKAYIFFKQASDLAPLNAMAKSALDDAASKLKPDQVAKANAAAQVMKEQRQAKREGRGTASPAPAAVAPAAPAASAPAPAPAPMTTPAAAPATAPAAPAATPESTPAPEKKKGGFRFPGFGQ